MAINYYRFILKNNIYDIYYDFNPTRKLKLFRLKVEHKGY